MARIYMESSDYYTPSNNSRNTSRRKKLEKARREIAASDNARVSEATLASKTLSITKQGDNYLFNCVDVLLKDKFSISNNKQLYTLYYKQYIEAIKSLFHNVTFILSAQNFGTTDRQGNLIDMEFLKSLRYEYNKSISTEYSYNTKSISIRNPNNISKNLIHVLEESQRIVDSFESIIPQIKQELPELYESLSKALDFKVRLLTISMALITSLENDRINLDDFKKGVYYGDRVSPIVGL